MRTYVKVVIFLAYVMTSLITGGAFTVLLLHNEILDVFEFQDQNGRIIRIQELEDDRLKVEYEYSVNKGLYHKTIKVGKDWFHSEIEDNNVIVHYNTSLPDISYINGLKMINGYYVILVIGLILLIMVVLISKFADREKWIARYKRIL